MIELKIYKTHPDIRLPVHHTEESSCFDISFQASGKSYYDGYTSGSKPFKRDMRGQLTIAPGERVMVPTGLIMDIPKGYSVRIHARSGTSLKQGLMLVNGEGVVDSDFVNEVMVLLTNIGINAVTIKDGDRIAQGELIKDVEFEIVQTPVRPGFKTSRTGGFGSTGIEIDKGDITIKSTGDVNITTDKKVRSKKVAENPS